MDSDIQREWTSIVSPEAIAATVSMHSISQIASKAFDLVRTAMSNATILAEEELQPGLSKVPFWVGLPCYV